MPANKYYRAMIIDNGKRKFMDCASYSGKQKFASDLRSNGYKVSLIVEITSEFEKRPEVYEKGSHMFL